MYEKGLLGRACFVSVVGFQPPPERLRRHVLEVKITPRRGLRGWVFLPLFTFTLGYTFYFRS